MGKREERKTQYLKKLIEKFRFNKQIKRLKKEHMPKYIYNARKKFQIMKESKFRKQENMELNNPNDLKHEVGEKKKKILTNLE